MSMSLQFSHKSSQPILHNIIFPPWLTTPKQTMLTHPNSSPLLLLLPPRLMTEVLLHPKDQEGNLSASKKIHSCTTHIKRRGWIPCSWMATIMISEPSKSWKFARRLDHTSFTRLYCSILYCSRAIIASKRDGIWSQMKRVKVYV